MGLLDKLFKRGLPKPKTEAEPKKADKPASPVEKYQSAVKTRQQRLDEAEAAAVNPKAKP